MRWYGAQLIMYVRFRDGDQRETPVWENTCLIHAPDFESALALAKERGKRDESDDDGSMTWGRRPAHWVFAGVRSVSEVFHEVREGELSHGDEVLFEEFIVKGLEAVEALVKGKSIMVELTELGDSPDRDAEEAPSAPNL